MRNQGSASGTSRSPRQRRPRSGDPATPRARQTRSARPHELAAASAAPRSRIELDALEGRSANPSVCPFLRVESDGALIAPVESPYGGNCCAALGRRRAVGDPQQEIVCLSGAFATCPLYGRGVARLAARRTDRRRGRRPLALRAAGVVLGVLAASVAGHTLAGTAHPGGGAPDAVVPAAYRGLEPCADGSGCYLYTVARGETLPVIARRLNQPITTILALNPDVVDSGELRVGDRLRVPPPGA